MDLTPIATSLRSKAIGGFAWAVVESWGGRLFAFITSLILARMLAPEEFGIAAAAALVLLVVPIVAQLGYDTAIAQRRGLHDDEINLPFFVSLGIAVAGGAIVLAFARPIAAVLGIPDSIGYLVAIAGILPLTIPLAFQEAIYRRRLRFGDLARRSLAANLTGGAAAIAAALWGAGVWALILQTYVVLLTSTVLLWRRPLWVPRLDFDRPGFAALTRFGVPTLAQRLIELIGSRLVDLLVILHIGLASYGLYVVGSRLHQTLMQLLQGMFFNVSLALLSQIADDRRRLAAAYRETISTSATLISPMFVLLAALSPEICNVLFDTRWNGVDAVARPLFLLGAVQCVQYMNGSFLYARGKPALVLVTGVVKTALIVGALLLFPSDSVGGMTQTFVVASLLAAPLSFAVVGREVGVRMGGIARIATPPATASVVCYLAASAARNPLEALVPGSFLRGMGMGTLFVGLYLPLIMALQPTSRAMLTRLVGELAGKLRNTPRPSLFGGRRGAPDL